jgi:hypothetical protein
MEDLLGSTPTGSSLLHACADPVKTPLRVTQGRRKLGKNPDATTIANIIAANSEIRVDIFAVETHASVLAAKGTSNKLSDIISLWFVMIYQKL